MEKEFTKRGWLWMPQPPQSPLLNINDCCIFPALSKHVSQMQGFRHGGRYIMDGEMIWDCVKSSYDSLPLDTIARKNVPSSTMSFRLFCSYSSSYSCFWIRFFKIGSLTGTPPPPAGPVNSASTPPQKKRRVGDKQLNLDQNGVFQFPTTEQDHRQLKLLSEILDVSFKSSGQLAITVTT